jgi:hypothetical protein
LNATVLRVRDRVCRLLPRSIGGQCLAGLVLGVLAVLLLGPKVEVLLPLGQIFLRASQIAVMPYLICELIGALGSLRPASMRLLSRTGGLVLLLILTCGALTVLLLPGLLPALTSSAFFSPELLQPPEPPDLVSTYLPFNIFRALADDNFPAVVLFAAVLGFLVQGLPRPELLLEPLEQPQPKQARGPDRPDRDPGAHGHHPQQPFTGAAGAQPGAAGAEPGGAGAVVRAGVGGDRDAHTP